MSGLTGRQTPVSQSGHFVDTVPFIARIGVGGNITKLIEVLQGTRSLEVFLQAAKRLRIVAPRAKILILSENNDPDVIKAAMSDGCSGYLLKSDAGSELLPAMAKVLRGERFLSSGTTPPAS
jgi:hypothetical protein